MVLCDFELGVEALVLEFEALGLGLENNSKRLEWRSATRTRERSVSYSRESGMGRSVGGAWESVSMGNGSITVPWTTVERKVGSMVFGSSFHSFTCSVHAPFPKVRQWSVQLPRS